VTVYPTRGRDRRPARRRQAAGARPNAPIRSLAGADIVVVGYFSAKQKDYAALMDAAAAEVTARGARVVGRLVQRRSVSNGGVKKLSQPYSSRTLLSSGKVREVAALCERSEADTAVFLTPLTEHQRRVLTEILGCPAVSLGEALTTTG
jgi:50S ribosomal subunit-associated GTPase HflX